MATEPETIETPIAEEGRAGGFSPQRLALILGVVVVIFFLVYLFFLRGGGEELPPQNLPPLTTPVPSETPEPEDEDDDDDGRVETFEVFAARDPFEPVVEEGGGGDEGEEGDEGDDAGDDDADASDDDADTDDDADDGTEVGGGDEGSETHRVRVVSVHPSRERAQVQIDGTVYEVDEGERFAENFQLVNASGQCATMLYGDDEFTLCEGEEILK